jgi:hypothetical protein
MRLVKLVKDDERGKSHVVPLHTNRTLCGESRTRWYVLEGLAANTEPTCTFCWQSLVDLSDYTRRIMAARV